MDITYEIMKDWIGDDVRLYFSVRSPLQGRLCEISNEGVFVFVENDEYFVPFAQVSLVKHIKETE